MANQQIFCNTPWYEAHIYWDGSLGICCQESRKLSNDHNIKTTTLLEWFNSAPVVNFRKEVLSDTPTDICSSCYHEESFSGTSRRHRSNQKSVIFTKTAFKDSFEQSPGRKHFTDDGITDLLPIDLHIDLGNYCNLACKMCWSSASSTIAVQNVLWGVESDRQYLGVDWTKDEVVWNRFLNELLTIPKLKNIHFMGGETLLTNRFENFVDFMILHERFDLNFSFVTNGTTFNTKLLEKLKQFDRIGIEVSIETTSEHNSYVRQGTNTAEVLDNIQRYKQLEFDVTIRPTIGALTVGYYHTLLDYCLEQQIIIKGLIINNPTWMQVSVLPEQVKQSYKMNYQNIIDKLNGIDISADYNESEKSNFARLVKVQAQQILNLLDQPIQPGIEQLVAHCRKWDNVYQLDAVKLYPELAEIFKQYDY
jgi:sulfatase maturation enzyme AslB (radical SAM superfamily)